MNSNISKLRRACSAIVCAGFVVAACAGVLTADTAAAPSMARDFTYEDVNPNSPTHGDRLSLSSLYAEQGVVLNFLASWCGYCWKELPELEQMQKAVATPIVGIAADEYDGPEALLGRIGKAKLSFPILLVPTADIKAIEQVYDHTILPATYLIDNQGSVRRVFEGLAPIDQLVEELRETVAQ